MTRRTQTSYDINEQLDRVESLWAGIGAMADPVVETRVLEHFLRYPSDSRDMVNIAAVACRVRDTLAAEMREEVVSPDRENRFALALKRHD